MSQQQQSHPWQRSVTSGARHSPEFVAGVLSALATASQAEIAAACGLSRNAIVGIVARAKKAGAVVTHKPRRQLSVVKPIARPVVAKPAPAPEPEPKAKPVRSRVPVAPPKVRPAAFRTGVTIVEATADECRALDDARHCCCHPVVPGPSWCAGHHAMYVVASRRAA